MLFCYKRKACPMAIAVYWHAFRIHSADCSLEIASKGRSVPPVIASKCKNDLWYCFKGQTCPVVIPSSKGTNVLGFCGDYYRENMSCIDSLKGHKFLVAIALKGRNVLW